jgi:hypothetical protein
MTSFVLTPQMREMILEAKARGGKAQCDPRAFYPAGHRCAATTRPVSPPVTTGTPQKSKPLIFDPRRLPIKLGPPVNATPDAAITQSVPTADGGAVTQIETADGDTVVTRTDANGGVRQVEVKNKWLMPAALAAAAFILFGG